MKTQQQLDLREYLQRTKKVVMFHEIEEIFMMLEQHMSASLLS